MMMMRFLGVYSYFFLVLVNAMFTKKREYDFKIAVVGDQQISKTALVNRFRAEPCFVNGSTASFSRDFTKGKIELDGKKIELQIWNERPNFGRTPKYVNNFYRGAHGIIIAYDITYPNSYKNAKQYLHEIERCTHEHCKKLIVGCKSDLKDTYKRTRQALAVCAGVTYDNHSGKVSILVRKVRSNRQRNLLTVDASVLKIIFEFLKPKGGLHQHEVPTQEVAELADSVGIKFMETSAKNGTNVEEAFMCLIKEIYEQVTAPGYQPPLPYWVNINGWPVEKKRCLLM